MRLLKLEKHMCGACNRLTAHLNGMEIPYESINIEDRPEIGAKYKAMAAPILIALDEDGEEIDRVEGFFPDKINDMLEKL